MTAGGAGVPAMRSQQAQAGTGGTRSRARLPPGGTGTTGAPTH